MTVKLRRCLFISRRKCTTKVSIVQIFQLKKLLEKCLAKIHRMLQQGQGWWFFRSYTRHFRRLHVVEAGNEIHEAQLTGWNGEVFTSIVKKSTIVRRNLRCGCDVLSAETTACTVSYIRRNSSSRYAISGIDEDSAAKWDGVINIQETMGIVLVFL